MITIERRVTRRAGAQYPVWQYGGHAVVESLKWCILKDGKVIAECRSKAAAEEIQSAFEWVGHGA